MPDLIIFPNEANPRIVDWKVEAPLNKEHRLQLAVYALALSKAKPHRDFPEMWREKPIDSLGIGLVEFQLLRNREQNYVLTTDDLVEVEDYIFRTSRAMSAAVDSNPSSLSPDLFRSTYFPSFCMHCKFRKICWKEMAS
jgi:CRISPR/Cas system-associated exonuclease Cas4 (RecB family)